MCDGDGWPDIFLVNGTTLEGFPKGKEPTSHLYHNNHDGTFTDVTQKSGAGISGWGQGVCAGDYDNDGRTDLYVTFWGSSVLLHNNGDGTFTDVTKKAGLWHDEPRWETGCAFLEYDRSGRVRPVRFAIRGPGFGKNARAGKRQQLHVERDSGDVRSPGVKRNAQRIVPQQRRWNVHRRQPEVRS